MRAKTIKQIKSEIRELAAMIWPKEKEHIRLLSSLSNRKNNYCMGLWYDDKGQTAQYTATMPVRELHAYLLGLQRGLNNIK